MKKRMIQDYRFFVIFSFYATINPMHSIIPKIFCGKKIQQNSAYIKIPITEHAGVFPLELWVKIGKNFLGQNLDMPVEDILTFWTKKYSLNQYYFFLEKISEIAEKNLWKADKMLHFIDEHYSDNFFKGVQAIKKSVIILQKIKHRDVLSVSEYMFLKSILIRKYAILSDDTQLFVERRFIEKFYVSKEQLIDNMILFNIANGCGVFVWCVCNSPLLQEVFTYMKIIQPLMLISSFFLESINNNSSITKTYNA